MVVEQETDAVSIKRVGDDSSESDAPPSKRLRVDSADADVPEGGFTLLDILNDDPDVVSAPETDLDSVMRSFEEEILHPPAPESDLGDAQPDLGYLLEASDDELGLPPALSPVVEDELPRYDSFGFQYEMPVYDPFGFGFGFGAEAGDADYGHFETVGDGLFEYPEEAEFSEYLWRPESLPAS